MDFERFKEFILESAARQEAAAARHDVEVAAIRDSLRSMANTVGRLVDNQVFLQESMGTLQESMGTLQESMGALARQTREDNARTNESLRELERIVFRHVTDPGAHNVN